MGVKLPDGYVLRRIGEVIREGDLFLSPGTELWVRRRYTIGCSLTPDHRLTVYRPQLEEDILWE